MLLAHDMEDVCKHRCRQRGVFQHVEQRRDHLPRQSLLLELINDFGDVLQKLYLLA